MTSIWIMLAVLVIYAPIQTFLHEFAHALPVLIRGGGAKIRVGSGRPIMSLDLISGRLSIGFGQVGTHGLGIVDYKISEMTRFLSVVVALMGPLCSLSLAIATHFAARASAAANAWFWTALIQGCCYFSSAQFLVTIFPWRYPAFWGIVGGYPSDGLTILRLICKTKRVE